jgi:hypothetical protein
MFSSANIRIRIFFLCRLEDLMNSHKVTSKKPNSIQKISHFLSSSTNGKSCSVWVLLVKRHPSNYWRFYPTFVTTHTVTLSPYNILVHCHHSISWYTGITAYPVTLSSQHNLLHCHYSIS